MKKIHMMMLTAAVALMGSLSSCKKDKNDPDPRESLVGSYELELGCDNGAEGEVDQKIVKSTSNDREVVFEDFLGSGADVRAEVTGTSFTLKKTTVQLTDANNTPFQASLTGSGRLSGKNLSIEFDVKNANVGYANSCEAEGEKSTN